MTTAVEARFSIEAQLCEIAATTGAMPLVYGLRFFRSDCRNVLVVVELDGAELEATFGLQRPIADDDFDESANMRRLFLEMPSMATH